ncbi:MAG: HEAT repeat domain-containing protein [Arenicellales bacterium]
MTLLYDAVDFIIIQGCLLGFSTASTLNITWPDGTVDIIKQAPLNTYIAIKQGENIFQTPEAAAIDSNSSLLLRDGRDKPEFRIHYLNILAAEQSPLFMAEISKALHDPAVEVRTAASELIESLPQKLQLPLLVTLLDDETFELRKRSLALLVKTEQEAIYRWLIRYLQHSEPDMRLIVTEAFYGYFRKEEAMVIHKYQAIPHLIRRLEDPSLEVKLAAIKALGASEHYRATGPLVDLLTDQSETIRRAAARALGHVRERFVINALNSTLEAESSPGVMANILISLKRLNALDVDDQLRTLITSDRLGANEKTALLRNLFQEDSGSTVFHPAGLTTLVTNRLRNTNAEKDKPEEVAASLDMLAVLDPPSSVPTLINFLTSQNPAVQQSACFGLAKLDLKKLLASHLSTCSSRINENPTRFFQDADESIAKGRGKLDFPAVKRLLPGLQMNVLAEQLSLFSIESVPTEWLFEIASLEVAPLNSRLDALRTLTHRNDAPTEISDQLLFHGDATIQTLAILYWGEHGINGQSPEIIITRFNQLLEKDNSADIIDAIAGTVMKMPGKIALAVLDQWLFDSTKKDAIRNSLLAAVSRNQSYFEIVLELARRRHETFSLEAILALGLYKDKRAGNYLHRIYSNTDETSQARVAAAIAFYPENASTIIPFLTGTLTNK